MRPKGRRFLGIELGGSRRTALVALDFFEQEGRVFLAGVESPVRQLGDDSPDEALIAAAGSIEAELAGVDAPLTLPPCLSCAEPACPGVRQCSRPAVLWMKAEAERMKWGRLPLPYAQRPVDFLLRGAWQEDVVTSFPVDDSFGAGRAPLAARMQYLSRHLSLPFLEVNPRLFLAGLALWFGISAREVRRSRDIEEGVEQRMGILEALGQEPKAGGLPHLFLYKAEITELAQDLAAFDGFLCGYGAVLSAVGLLEEPAFDPAWGWMAKLKRPRKESA
jgi:hypothetical protein